MKTTDAKTTVVETNHDRAFNRIYADEEATGIGESLLVSGLSQGEIHDGC